MATDRSSFHAACAAIAITGVVMLFTGGDLGPYGPIMIGLGIYAVVLALACEGMLAAIRGVARLRAMRAARAHRLAPSAR